MLRACSGPLGALLVPFGPLLASPRLLLGVSWASLDVRGSPVGLGWASFGPLFGASGPVGAFVWPSEGLSWPLQARLGISWLVSGLAWGS